MSDTTTSQLGSVLSELESQEEALSQQLEEIKKKQEALHKVIVMFEGEDSSIAATLAPASKKTTANRKPAAQKKTTAKKAAVKKTATKATKATTKKKKDGRTADWQKYTLSEMKDHPMPEAVKIVLATAPNKDFKIATVMSGLFKENMPKAQYLKARNRVSNILSGGVRDGEWYKGDRGAHRMNKA
ncbi:MAG: hypothetical protein AAF810_07080 [Cyanobacteria bacterium P01_D01_bin.36]